MGAMVGLLAAVIMIRNAPRVTIDPYAIVVYRHIARPLRIPQTSVATAYFDSRGKLTILGTDGQPAFAGDVDGKKGPRRSRVQSARLPLGQALAPAEILGHDIGLLMVAPVDQQHEDADAEQALVGG
ncbi:YqeB family protein [Bowdeniella nasicola]|uniref:YqeB family protein n=1 Tax=Bowdeniella nasicola TaxID=208480 RepID=UPI003CCBB4FD